MVFPQSLRCYLVFTVPTYVGIVAFFVQPVGYRVQANVVGGASVS